MQRRVAGLFERQEVGEQVRQALLDEGVLDNTVRLFSNDTLPDEARGTGPRGLFRDLFHLQENDDRADRYAEAMRRGGCVVVVEAEDDDAAERAGRVMSTFEVIDIDEQATRWRSEGWQGYDSASAPLTGAALDTERERMRPPRQDEAVTRIPVVEEDLAVGKREVGRRAVRVYFRMTEVPVEQTVELREEHAHVERHPVDRPVTPADLNALPPGGVVEVRETAEVPVVQKTARVVEEVEVGKTVDSRQETVRDTVRRTDVRVEDHAEAAGRASGGDVERGGEAGREPRTTPRGTGGRRS
jgi:stress response protein YsnF